MLKKQQEILMALLENFSEIMNMKTENRDISSLQQFAESMIQLI